MLKCSNSVVRKLALSNIQAIRWNSSSSFAGHRVKYKGQLSEMRKVWKDDFDKRAEIKRQQQLEEQRKIVQAKAIRIREKRLASLIRQEAHRKRTEEAIERKRLNLAREHMYWDKKQAKQQSLYKRLAEDLRYESPCWITHENLEEKITTDLFSDKPSTTGLVTPYSSNWRYNIVTYKYDFARMMSPQSFVHGVDTIESRLTTARNEREYHKRKSMEDFLEPMVGSGEERAQLKELVDEYLQIFGKLEPPTDAEDQMELDDEQDRQLLERDLDQPDYHLENLLHRYGAADSEEDDLDDDDEDMVIPEDWEAAVEEVAQELARRNNLDSAEVKAALLRKLQKNTPEELATFNSYWENLEGSDEDEADDNQQSFGSAALDEMAVMTPYPGVDAELRAVLDTLTADELQELKEEIEKDIGKEATEQINSRKEALDLYNMSPEEREAELHRLEAAEFFEDSDDEVVDRLSPEEREAELRRLDTQQFFEDSDDEAAGKGKTKK